MTHSSLPFNPSKPFVAAGMIEDPRLFVGRGDELQAIVSRMTGAQPTSINIYGDKRIGKSSLLYHFFFTWEQRVQNPSSYVVIYLSLQNVQCQSETQVYQAIAQELLNSHTVANNQALSDSLRVTLLDRLAFSQAMKKWKQEGVLPVLCLDDFKTLFKKEGEFDNGFYDNLRSLMDTNTLMLIIASEKKLDFYSKKYKFTSSFFNLGHVIKLGELKKHEVKDLLRLPHNNNNNLLPALSMDEQSLTEQLGLNHPFLLQMAGRLVCDARDHGHDKKWVKEKFQSESKRLRYKSKSQGWQHQVHWLLWDLPVNLGKFTKFIGNSMDDVSNWILGIIIIIGIILILTGLVKHPQFLSFILDKLGIK